ncbi:3-oxoacyl-[acyl-carrier-protein] synthase-3 [Clostridium sp. DSM 8431]|uniref:beta-ketoacyl-ACP synthase III n=1 Tax=Clostridium sp. DSM 8431 TaxID=1761781 RepID=UPI0008DF3C25|nr:beta-ketoacyl-ACP synthase III [Clostridium sp. DSM 8431]SFU59518.1 3-oxoacyl-[acyl-carrier-protein] synthase-3 [Clostridium sp. DSM 8431]
MSKIYIKNFGAYVPKKVVTNDMLSKIVDTSDEWISTRTGIKERRISEGENTSDLAVKAINKILKKENLEGKEIDLIITATLTPDNIMPSTACIIQKKIEAEKAMAFDINAACSGFMYALEVAYSMMEMNKKYKNVLVVGSEVLSKIVDWKDRNTCVLFGDGAGAVLLQRGNEEKLTDFYSYSQGKKGDALVCGGLDILNPYVSLKHPLDNHVKMDGREIFKFASRVMIDAIKTLAQNNNIDINDIDFIVPHQANERIIKYTADKLHISFDKFYLNLDKYGNTSSASIPMALSEMNDKGLIKSGMKIVMVGFGGGLTVGSILIEI